MRIIIINSTFCLIILLLLPIIGTLAATFVDWLTSCQQIVTKIGNMGKAIGVNMAHDNQSYVLVNTNRLMTTLTALQRALNGNPGIDGREAILKQRLDDQLSIAIGICANLAENGGSSKNGSKKGDQRIDPPLIVDQLHAIIKIIRKEFNTFLIELELDGIRNEEWTVEKLDELEKALENFDDDYEKTIEILEEKFRTMAVKLSNLEEKIKPFFNEETELDENTFCNRQAFRRAWFRIVGRSSDQDPRDPDSFQNVREAQQIVVELLLDVKMDILKNEMDAKFALFIRPNAMINGDGLIGFSHKFVDEWKQIDAMIEQDHQWTTEGMKAMYRRNADALAERAFRETTLWKRVSIRVLAILSLKCQKAIAALKTAEFNDHQKQTEQKQQQQMLAAFKKLSEDFLVDMQMYLGISDREIKLLDAFEKSQQLAKHDDKLMMMMSQEQQLKLFVQRFQQTVDQLKDLVAKAYLVKEVEESTKSLWTGDFNANHEAIDLLTNEYAHQLGESEIWWIKQFSLGQQIVNEIRERISRDAN